MPHGKELGWQDCSILWETKNPYLYMRTTIDGRIIVGGRDEEFSNAEKRDALLASKTHQLEEDFHELFPDVPFQTDFAWAGTFAKTKTVFLTLEFIKSRKSTMQWDTEEMESPLVR